AEWDRRSPTSSMESSMSRSWAAWGHSVETEAQRHRLLQLRPTQALEAAQMFHQMSVEHKRLQGSAVVRQPPLRLCFSRQVRLRNCWCSYWTAKRPCRMRRRQNRDVDIRSRADVPRSKARA